MSWRDRDYADDPARRFGRPGGDWQGIRPSLDNPMTWAVSLGRVFGILIRVHAVFLLWIVIRLGQSLVAPDRMETASRSFGLEAMELACLFTIVLLHEFGHCLACRRTGGDAEEILMWPLGGLAYCLPPNHWRAHLITVLGGPLVNVVIYALMVPIIGVMTERWGHALWPMMYTFGTFERETWALLVLEAIHRWNLILLLFNLLPIFPLDGGRICQAALWPRFGYAKSMRLAVYAGYFGAIALGIFGAVLKDFMLVAIAIFGGITCYVTLKQMEWTEAVVGGEDSLYAQSLWDDATTESPRAEKRRAAEAKKAERRQAEREEELREVDRILAKIAEQGMGSLTGREKRLLRHATEQKRGKAGGGG